MGMWAAYKRVLAIHPIRTKMATAATLFAVGDSIAQFGIEGRTLLPKKPDAEAQLVDAEKKEAWDVSYSLLF